MYSSIRLRLPHSRIRADELQAPAEFSGFDDPGYVELAESDGPVGENDSGFGFMDTPTEPESVTVVSPTSSASPLDASDATLALASATPPSNDGYGFEDDPRTDETAAASPPEKEYGGFETGESDLSSFDGVDSGCQSNPESESDSLRPDADFDGFIDEPDVPDDEVAVHHEPSPSSSPSSSFQLADGAKLDTDDAAAMAADAAACVVTVQPSKAKAGSVMVPPPFVYDNAAAERLREVCTQKGGKKAGLMTSAEMVGSHPRTIL
jgi:hypothetical protein